MSEAPPGNAANGKKIFTRNCQSCHNVSAGNKHAIGPSLQTVYGRKVASAKGFKYSAALAAKKAGSWTVETLNPWLENPAGYASGTSMAYEGVKNQKEREDLIRYLFETNPKNKAK